MPHRTPAICSALESRVLLSTWYVATNGTDGSGHGTSPANPWRTINYGANHLAYGDTLLIEGGTYRETVNLPSWPASYTGKQTVLKNYDSTPVTIKGADIVTGWTQYSGNMWMKTGWTTFSRQVFVDQDATGNPPLTEIGQANAMAYDQYRYIYGSDQTTMFPGSFYDDTANDVLYVWLPDGSNPNNHTMEVSTRRYWVTAGYRSNNDYASTQWLIQGLNFRDSDTSSANSANWQPLHALQVPPNSTLKSCDVEWADFGGVTPMGSNVQILDNNISHNGDVGIQVGTVSNYLISGNTINYNDYRYYEGWNCGGMKIIPNAWGTVSNNEVGFNNWVGIWLDTDNSGNWSTVSGNYVHDTVDLTDTPYYESTWTVDATAIHIEISSNVLVYNNLVANNQGSGISIIASQNTYVYNNTVTGSQGYAAIMAGGVPRHDDGTSDSNFVNYPLQHNRYYNNLIYNNPSLFDLLVQYDFNYTDKYGYTHTAALDNLSDYNLIYRWGGPLQLSNTHAYRGNMGAVQTTLAYWQSIWNGTPEAGQDAHSLSSDPLILNPGSTELVEVDLTLASNSPAVAAGMNLSTWFSNDYAGYARPASGAWDIGAYQYHSGDPSSTPAALPPADPTVWVDDTFPQGAVPANRSGSSSPYTNFWRWTVSGPAAYSGQASEQLATCVDMAGTHQTKFTAATATMNVVSGDTLYAYVYLDPADPPSEIMIQWGYGSTWQSAYWGSSNPIGSSAYHAGNLPSSGQWVRLQVPASAVGLAGHNVSSLALATYNGRASWDKIGRVPANYASTITGGSEDDHYYIRRDSSGAYLEVFAGDSPAGLLVRSDLYSSLLSFTFNGSAGDDQLTLDWTNGSPIPAGGLFFNGGTGNNTLAVAGTASAGTVTLTGGSISLSAANGSTAALTLAVTNAGTTLHLDSPEQLAGLALSSGGSATVAPGGDNTLLVKSLTISGGGTLDLSDNSMVWDYTGPVGTLLDDTRLMLKNNQLTSSNADSTHQIGYFDNASLGLATFGGQSVDPSSILIKFTFGGDANLDGMVDVTDLGVLATYWQSDTAVWPMGDFNYDGNVDVTDLGILATNWQKGVGSSAVQQSVAASTDLAPSTAPVLSPSRAAVLGRPSVSVAAVSPMRAAPRGIFATSTRITDALTSSADEQSLVSLLA